MFELMIWYDLIDYRGILVPTTPAAQAPESGNIKTFKLFQDVLILSCHEVGY